MRAMQRATRAPDYREEDFRADAATDPDVPKTWPEVDALLIKNSRPLTGLMARLAALIDRNVIEESQRVSRSE